MRYGLSTHHLVYEHPMQWLESSFHYFNNHKCIKWPNHHKNNWSLQCSSTNNNIISLINNYTTIMVQTAKIKLLSRTNLRHLDGITLHQNITDCKMPNFYTARTLLIINKRFSPNTNLGCIIILGHHSRLSVFHKKNWLNRFHKWSDRSWNPVRPVSKTGWTGLSRECTLVSTNIGLLIWNWSFLII